MAEMHFLQVMWDESDPPAWLLYFVFRSLLCWHIYEERLVGSLPTANNLLQLLQEETGANKVLSMDMVMQSKTLTHCLISALNQEQWKSAITKLGTPDFQQGLFHWNPRAISTSQAIVEFLAELFTMQIQIVSAQGELLYSSVILGSEERPVVNIKCGNVAYSIYQGTIKQRKKDQLYLTAFAHVSSRTLAHESVVTLIAKMLEIMRRPPFWEDIFIKKALAKWAKLLVQAHQDIKNLVEEYQKLESKWGLATSDTCGQRPKVPDLQHLIPGMKTILAEKDHRGWPQCDVRVKMSVAIRHPTNQEVKLNLKDLRPSEDNPIPKHMFIVGGNSFTRGTTLSDPLVTVFTRFSDNQEDLTQYMRMLGHRKPEAIDLMCAIGGFLQKEQFAKLWGTMANNTVLLIDSWLQNKGVMDAARAPGFLQTTGMQAAPKVHMHYTQVVSASPPQSSNKIIFLSPPLHGHPSLLVFHLTNQLFNHILEKYASSVHMPGLPVKKYSARGEYPHIYPYSSPGIVFRGVLVDDALLYFFREQAHFLSSAEHSDSTPFSSLVGALEELQGSQISICFAHKKARVPDPEYLDKYNKAVNLPSTSINLLHYVTPLRTQRKDPPYASFSRDDVSVKWANRVDAVKLPDLSKKKRKGREKAEILPDFEHYVEKLGTKLKRSRAAPALLNIALLDPKFKQKNSSNRDDMHSPTDCADYPPSAYILYPLHAPRQPTFSFVYPAGGSSSSSAKNAKRPRPSLS